jgi:hypothetical protein
LIQSLVQQSSINAVRRNQDTVLVDTKGRDILRQQMSGHDDSSRRADDRPRPPKSRAGLGKRMQFQKKRQTPPRQAGGNEGIASIEYIRVLLTKTVQDRCRKRKGMHEVGESFYRRRASHATNVRAGDSPESENPIDLIVIEDVFDLLQRFRPAPPRVPQFDLEAWSGKGFAVFEDLENMSFFARHTYVGKVEQSAA